MVVVVVVSLDELGVVDGCEDCVEVVSEKVVVAVIERPVVAGTGALATSVIVSVVV